MWVLALTVKTEALRGQLMVVRPFAGGQGWRRDKPPPQAVGVSMGTGDIVEGLRVFEGGRCSAGSFGAFRKLAIVGLLVLKNPRIAGTKLRARFT